MNVSARAHTPIRIHDRNTYIQTDIQTDTNTHTYIHDTSIGHILAFVICLGNTYDVHVRMHLSYKHVCKRSVRTGT